MSLQTLWFFLQQQPALAILIAGIFSLLVGSFLNVVIYRLPLAMEAHWQREAQNLLVASEAGRFTVDLGIGGALFSRSRFGVQDFGGPFQFALTLGASAPLYKQLGLGYRFLHYSDMGLHGPHTTGADFHMLEFSYRF